MGPVVSETEDARGSQPETALLVEADVQWVARRIVESHETEFLSRMPGGGATPCSGYSRQLCCQLNPWEISDVLPYPVFLCLPHREFGPVPYILNSPLVDQGCSNDAHSSPTNKVIFLLTCKTNSMTSLLAIELPRAFCPLACCLHNSHFCLLCSLRNIAKMVQHSHMQFSPLDSPSLGPQFYSN